MELSLSAVASLAVACLVLLIGRLVNAAVPILARYSIPQPVVGGLIVALLLTAARFGVGLEVDFDASLQSPLMVAFFATVGLGSDARMIGRGGPRLLLYLGLVVVVLLVQNGLGLVLARLFDLHPTMGLIAGSITLSGGHGTGAAYAQLFGTEFNLQSATELAMACATFGLVLGGIVGGPTAERLIRRHNLKAPAGAAAEEAVRKDAEAITASTLLEALLYVALALWIGDWLAQRVTLPAITLPGFVWSLLVAILFRNLLGPIGLFRVPQAAIDLLGSLALSLFLAMALMRLRLWELIALAVPILVILAAQTLAIVGYASLVTFRVMGKSYDAALLAAGQCGFGLGATPTAIANMQAITRRYGHSAEPFLIVPVVGAFLIDICNAVVIQGLLALPPFGP